MVVIIVSSSPQEPFVTQLGVFRYYECYSLELLYHFVAAYPAYILAKVQYTYGERFL